MTIYNAHLPFPKPSVILSLQHLLPTLEVLYVHHTKYYTSKVGSRYGRDRLKLDIHLGWMKRKTYVGDNYI